MTDTATQTGPTITRRALVTHTLKDGWRVAEVSVSVTGEEPGKPFDLAPLIAQTWKEADGGIGQITGQPF